MAVKREEGQLNANGLPRLPLDLWAYKKPIAIQWTIIILTSGVLPIIGYFALRYTTDLELNIVFAPWLALTGVSSLYSLLLRSWLLFKKDSNCRPLGSPSRWTMDFFYWNFIGGFLGLTALISAGISSEIVRVVSLPLSILILYTSIELMLVSAGTAAGINAPFRLSSTPGGAPLRPGSFAITEDVVAVDGKQGRAWRQAWSDRYEASPVFRAHLRSLDLIWGVTGLCVVAVVWGVVFGVQNADVGYVVGWTLPWIWAGVMTLVTIWMSKRMLKREGEEQRMDVAA